MESQKSQTTASQPTATDPPITVRTELVEGSGSTESTSMPDNLRTILETFHEKIRVKERPECSRNRYQPRKRNWKMFDRVGEDVGIAQFKVIVTNSWQLTYYAWVVYPKSEPPKLVITTKVGSHRTYYLEWLGHDAGFEERHCAVRIWRNEDKEISFDPDFWESVPAFFTPSERRVALLSEGDSDSDTSMDVDEHAPYSSPPYELRSKRCPLVAVSDSDDDTECERSGPVTRSSRKRPVAQHDSLIVPLRGPKIARLVRHFHISERRDGIEKLDNGSGHECHLVEDSVDKPGSPKPGADGRSDEQDEHESEWTDCSSDAGVPQDNDPETQGTGTQEQMAQDDDGMEVCETGGSGSDESDSEGESDSYESSSEESDNSSSEEESSDEEVEEPTNGVSGAVAKAVGNNKNNENDGNHKVNEVNGPATPTSTGNAAHPSDSRPSMAVREPQLTNDHPHLIKHESSSSASTRHSSIHGTGVTSGNFPAPASMSSGRNDRTQVTGAASPANLPTRTPTTVDRRVRFMLVGHPNSRPQRFTPQSQQPGAELFAKAEEYFEAQTVDVLYCFVAFEEMEERLTKNCLEDVDRCITQWERGARLTKGGVVYVKREPEPFDF
jgi:hypothetical protein